MPISDPEIILGVNCGDLLWLDCLSEQNMIKARDILSGMSNAELRRVKKLLSGCILRANIPHKNGSADINPAASSKCIEKFVENMCDEDMMLAVAGLETLLELSIIMSLAKFTPKWRNALLALSVSLAAWRTACTTKTVTASVLRGLCHANELLRNIADYAVPDVIERTEFMKELKGFMNNGTFIGFINACCQAAEIQAVALPLWACQPEVYYTMTRTDSTLARPSYWDSIPNMVLS